MAGERHGHGMLCVNRPQHVHCVKMVHSLALTQSDDGYLVLPHYHTTKLRFVVHVPKITIRTDQQRTDVRTFVEVR